MQPIIKSRVRPEEKKKKKCAFDRRRVRPWECTRVSFFGQGYALPDIVLKGILLFMYAVNRHWR